MEIDFDKMTPEEIKELQAKADKALAGRKAQMNRDAVKAVRQTAKDHGFTLDEIFLLAKPKSAQSAAPKYRDPDAPDNIWSGRGARPVWLKEKLEQGKKLEDFLISKA